MHPLCYSDQMALLDNFVELLGDHKHDDSDLLSQAESWLGQLSKDLTFAASVRRHLEDVLQIVRAGKADEATDLARSALVYLTQSGGPAASELGEMSLQAHAFVLSLFLHKIRRIEGETSLYVPAELEQDDRERAEDIFEKFLNSPMSSDADLIQRAREFCQNPGIPVDIDFVRRLLRNAEFLVSILEGVGHSAEDFKVARAALSYLVLEEDSIDDRLGLIGFIDDSYILDTAVSLIEPARQPWLQLLQATAWCGPLLNQAKVSREDQDELVITQEALTQVALLSEPWALSGGPLNAALFTPTGGSAPIVLGFASLMHWLGQAAASSDTEQPDLVTMEAIEGPGEALLAARRVLDSDRARAAEQFIVLVAPHERSRELVSAIKVDGVALSEFCPIGYRNPEGVLTNWSSSLEGYERPLLLFVPSLKDAEEVVAKSPGRVRLTLVDIELAVRGEDEEEEEDVKVSVTPPSLKSTVDSKSGDVLEAYIGETTAIPRISSEEEERLSLQMEAGRRRMALGLAIVGASALDHLAAGITDETFAQIEQLQATIDRARKSNSKKLAEHVEKQAKQIEALGLDDDTFIAAVNLIKPYLGSSMDPSAVKQRWKMDATELRRGYKELLTGRHQVDEAVVELTRGNLRLVLWMAKKYRNRTSSFLDMVQEGNVGLMRGARKFSHRKGARFGTYASWWVRQSIERYLAHHSRTIRIPVRALNTIKQVNRTAQELSARLGRIPKEDEIAAQCDLSPEVVARAIRVAHELGSGTVTLDGTLDGESEVSLKDVVADDATPAPFEEVSNRELANATHQLLETLKPMEASVLKMRFGIGTGSRMTLEQIGQEVGLTRERIRQIELKALGKLRFRAKRMGVGP